MLSRIKYLLIISIAFVPMISMAQMGKAYDMTVNGVKVIVQPSGNDIVVIQTIIRGGVQNYPAEKAGIESIAMTALTECGTAKDDKNSFKDKLDKVSARVNGSTGMDYATFSLNCIKSDFQTVWPLYVDALTTPRFEAKEFERIKQDAVNILRANESNPDFAIDKMARQVAFNGKSYAKDPQGTVDIINKLTPAETKKYWESIFTKSRMVIVVVADIEKDDLVSKINQLLAKVPAGIPSVIHLAGFSPFNNQSKYCCCLI